MFGEYLYNMMSKLIARLAYFFDIVLMCLNGILCVHFSGSVSE